jgi:hypothetical protein
MQFAAQFCWQILTSKALEGRDQRPQSQALPKIDDDRCKNPFRAELQPLINHAQRAKGGNYADETEG